jgi:hypothetical protein
MTLNNSAIPVSIIGPDNQAALGTRVFVDSAASGSGHTLAPGEKLWMRYIFRTANATPETVRQDTGSSPPFHHLLDPGTVASAFTLIYEDLVFVTAITAGVRAVVGHWQYVTAGDKTTLMGIGFYADQVDNKWHPFVFDSATGGAPYTSLYDVTTLLLCTAPHRMKIIIDGPTKTITWYIDGVQVGTYTPVAALRFVAGAANVTGTNVMTGGFVPANQTLTIRNLAGSIPLLRIRVMGTPTVIPPATGGGTSMSVSVA